MRVSFRCDCGAGLMEESVVSDEISQPLRCAECRSRFIVTLTRIEDFDVRS